MRSDIPSTRLVGLLVLAAAAPLRAGQPLPPTGPGVVYELRSGSWLLDDCPACARRPDPLPLEGTFVAAEELVPGAGVRVFQITHVDLRTSGGESTVRGTGSWEFGVFQDPTQALTLQVAIDGEEGIELQGVGLPIGDPWPFLDIAVDEVTASVTRVYRLRVFAAPQAPAVSYELAEASTFTDDCPLCAVVPVPVPLSGTFDLTPVAQDSLFVTYRLDSIDFRDRAGDRNILIAGTGKYVQGGEVAVTQEMVLDLLVTVAGGQREALLDSGSVPVPAGLPALDVSLKETKPPTLAHVYELHIVAKPSPPPPAPFLRGDANADGTVDLSDPVHVISWLFVGVPEPGCLAALDANGDGTIDLTDAVFLLGYLYQGQAAPPDPGPAACGPDPAAGPGCGTFEACPKG